MPWLIPIALGLLYLAWSGGKRTFQLNEGERYRITLRGRNVIQQVSDALEASDALILSETDTELTYVVTMPSSVEMTVPSELPGTAGVQVVRIEAV